jgi:hypothetical protein
MNFLKRILRRLDPKDPGAFSNGVASRRERAGVPAGFLHSHEELADAGQVEKQINSNTRQPIIVLIIFSRTLEVLSMKFCSKIFYRASPSLRERRQRRYCGHGFSADFLKKMRVWRPYPQVCCDHCSSKSQI